MIPRSDLPSRLPELAALVRAAGEAVLAVRARGFAVETKDDDSPVTAADRQAEHILADGLARIAPGIPVVAEEAAAAGNIPDVSASFWLVDPVDGTKEFVQGSGEFTVNVALVECGRPVLGLVLAPALGRLFTGVAGQGAWVEDAAGRRPPCLGPAPQLVGEVFHAVQHPDKADPDDGGDHADEVEHEQRHHRPDGEAPQARAYPLIADHGFAPAGTRQRAICEAFGSGCIF